MQANSHSEGRSLSSLYPMDNTGTVNTHKQGGWKMLLHD